MMFASNNKSRRGAAAPALLGLFALLLLASELRQASPWTILWAGPAILLSAIVIAWGAESAQYFIAQGFALAILALLQTLPEFAVEAVLAWRQQVPFLFANLTGALRMLTGLGWPMIYFAAATVHRGRSGKNLGGIQLEHHHAVEVIGLLPPLLYMSFVLWKGSLTVYDGLVLIAIYVAYLVLLSRMPPEDPESVDDLESVPRAIVLSPKPRRIALITLCFVAGGGLIYFTAEPFLASLMSFAALVGIPSFVFIQWVAPFVSEFPEMASTYYFARTVTKAPMALMNMVSSNINQWTLLAAMLPILYSFSRGSASALVFDERQKLEVFMTIGQALLGWLFLVNMELRWWEATLLLVLWALQFILSALMPGHPVHGWIALSYFVLAAWEIVRMLTGAKKPEAFRHFAGITRTFFR